MARGALARVRRGDQLLGARRDGAPALRPRRERRRGDDAGTGGGDARGARPRSRGAALAGGGAAGPARLRVASGRRRALRRLAHVLRAPGGVVPGGPRLRGLPLRRHGAARLRRPPAGMVARDADLRADAGPPGAPGAAARLGRRQAQLREPEPGAAARAGDARAAPGPRPGPARAGREGHHRARRRDPPLRGRDGADAPRRGSPRAGRETSTSRPATWPAWRCPRR